MKHVFFLLGLLVCSQIYSRELSVTVITAGTLESVVREQVQDVYSITSLTVSGPLNGDDIVFIRDLCGTKSYSIFNNSVPSNYYYDETTGSVKSYPFPITDGKVSFLDLSDAYIVVGGGPYFYKDSPYRTDYGKVALYTENNTLYYAVFQNCNSLKRVILPNSLSKLCRTRDDYSLYATTPHINMIVVGQNLSIWDKFTETSYTPNSISVDTIVCHSLTPPTCSTANGWDTNTVVYIPEESLSLYQSATYWKSLTLKTDRSVSLPYNSWYSTNHDDNSESGRTFRLFVPSGATLSFDYYVSSEEDCDIFKITLNGKTLVNKSGDIGAKTYSGTFTSDIDGDLVIKYTKDEMSSAGTDSAAITNIKITIPNAKYEYPMILKTSISSFTLYENEYKNAEDFWVTELKYDRTFNNTSYQSLYVPFSMSYDDWSSDFDVYRLNDVHQFDTDDDGVMDKTELEICKVKSGSIEPNTPYIIKAKTTGDKTITLADATLYKTESNSFEVTSWNTTFTFTGTYEKIDGQTMYDNGYYAMGGGALAQAADNTASLGAFRWYLSVTDRNGNQQTLNNARIAINCIDDDTVETNIAQIANNLDSEAPIYDMSGRKVGDSRNGLKAGIYVQQGHKFMVK